MLLSRRVTLSHLLELAEVSTASAVVMSDQRPSNGGRRTDVGKLYVEAVPACACLRTFAIDITAIREKLLGERCMLE